MSASSERDGTAGRTGRETTGRSGDLVLEAVSGGSGLTAVEVASATGLGRSTVGKALVVLEQASKVRRGEGGRDGVRRLPDRWTIADASTRAVEANTAPGPASDAADRPADADHGPTDETPEQDAVTAGPQTGAEASGRLRPGQLDGLVLVCLTRQADEGQLGPGAVAKALGRSSGAVANCLARLTSAGRLRLATEHPRRYGIVVSESNAGAAAPGTQSARS